MQISKVVSLRVCLSSGWYCKAVSVGIYGGVL